MPFCEYEPKVEVRRSPVHGWGLFSKCSIRYGEVICLYSGDLLSTSDMYINRSDYVLDLGSGRYLDSNNRYNCAGRYINDSHGVRGSRNNARYSSVLLWHDVMKKYYVNVICNRHIAPDREIFADYGKEYWDNKTQERKGVICVNNFATQEELKKLDMLIGIL